MEKCLTSIEELFLLPKFDNSSSSVTRDKEICQSYGIMEVMRQSKNGTLWIRFTCCPNLVSSFSWAKNFQTGNFADFEQFKIDTHFANFRQVQIDSNWLSLLSLGRSQIFYWLWARCQAAKKSRTRHRIWHKSFSMIQWAVIKNWVPLLVNRLQGFNYFL